MWYCVFFWVEWLLYGEGVVMLLFVEVCGVVVVGIVGEG